MNIEQAVSQLENMKMLKGYDNTTVNGRPLDNVIDDIIGLLKSYVPRVMTLEEVQAAKNDIERYGRYTEILENDYNGYKFSILYPGLIRDGRGGLRSSNGICVDYLINEDNYGKDIRCWTAYPSKEQRYETDWE